MESDIDTNKIDIQNIKDTIKLVINNLDELGYNAIKQVAGYLQSGDLGYISNYKDSRNIISKLDRNAILETLINNIL
jgi:uncharacterized protein (UPF0297 family)